MPMPEGLYEPRLTDIERSNYYSMARRCARGVRGCMTEDQYIDLLERIVEALAFASGKIALSENSPQ
jgi:hypothetical protein